ncbi:sodium-coupled monocarboxylate transporter 1-like [Tubulanus polymorphus]|uniref:sodium-coupled monocarboxylate transporter 1-like n=1 Tax=Tubulanus polymorphus TaxID=672921 RepID=UPI003DA527AA
MPGSNAEEAETIAMIDNHGDERAAATGKSPATPDGDDGGTDKAGGTRTTAATPSGDECTRRTIAVAAFLVNVIAGGYATSFGIFLDQFLVYFSENSAFQTTFIASLLQNVPLLVAPVTYILVNRYGSRCICMIGGLFLCVGHILSFFASDIGVLIIGIGIVAGLGLSFAYVPAVTAVEIYFGASSSLRRQRSHVIGMTQTGSGIGTILLANMAAFLVQFYGWRGASLVFAGVLFNVCVCGALFRPLASTKKYARRFLIEDGIRSGDPRILPELENISKKRRYSTLPESAFDRVCGNLMFTSMVQLPTYIEEDSDLQKEPPERTNIPVNEPTVSMIKSAPNLKPKRTHHPLDDLASLPNLTRHVLLKNASEQIQRDRDRKIKVCLSAPNLWGGPPRIETMEVSAAEINSNGLFQSTNAIMSEESFSAWDYVVFGIVLVVSAGIGIYYGCTGNRQSTTHTFLMADRQMSFFPVSLSLLASFMSAITILGTPAELYVYGTQYMAIGLSYFFVCPLAAHVFIPMFYNLGVTSVFEYLELRFHKALRIACACCFIFQMTLYMAIVLYAPSLALNAVTGFTLWGSVIAVGIVCTFYTTIGGMKAVMWTDTFQVCMMFAGLIAVIVQGCIDHGGWSNVWAANVAGDRIEFFNFDMDPKTRHTVWSLAIGGYFTWIAIYGVNQAQVQRAITVPKLKYAQIAMWINLPGLVLLMTLSSMCGMIIYATYKDCDPLTLGLVKKQDQLLPLFVMQNLNHVTGLPGLFVACLFSGSLSTISSGLNSLAAITLKDIVLLVCCKGMNDKRATIVAKILAVIYGVICIGLTFVAAQLGGVLQAALGLFGMIGGPVLGVFTLGMFIPWSNWKGSFIGLISGLIVTLWIGIGAQVHKPFNPKATVSIAGCNITSNFTTSVMTSTMTMTTTVPESTSQDLIHGGVYNVSYMWYSLIAVITTVTIGVIFSFITGGENTEDLDPRLIVPVFDKFCCCLPKKFRDKMHCGIPRDESQKKKFIYGENEKGSSAAAEEFTIDSASSPSKSTSRSELGQDNPYVVRDTPEESRKDPMTSSVVAEPYSRETHM